MAKKRNKAYKPKPVHPGGGLLALLRIDARGQNASPLNDDQLADIGSGYWLALTNLTQGNASEESLGCVITALNIGLVLAETVFDHQHEEDFVHALDGAFRAKIRREKAGTCRLDGEAMKSIRFALECHDLQMQLAHRKEIVAAMATVQARIKAGNVYTPADPELLAREAV